MRFLFFIMFCFFNHPVWAACTNPYRPEGQIVYNQDWGVFQGCTPAGWVRFNAPTSSPAPTCLNIGDVCTGGYIYAGEYAGHKLYVTGEDAPGSYTWNNGNTGERPDLNDSFMPNCPLTGTPHKPLRFADITNPACSGARGKGYTEYSANFIGLGAPYNAAGYCYHLGKPSDPAGPDNPLAHGRGDWYLPAIDEFDFLYENLGPQPKHGFKDDYYWTSTEFDEDQAWYQVPDSGFQGTNGKVDDYRVRCVARGN